LAIHEAELSACAKDIAERELELREREAKISSLREQTVFEQQALVMRAQDGAQSYQTPSQQKSKTLLAKICRDLLLVLLRLLPIKYSNQLR